MNMNRLLFKMAGLQKSIKVADLNCDPNRSRLSFWKGYGMRARVSCYDTLPNGTLFDGIISTQSYRNKLDQVCTMQDNLKKGGFLLFTDLTVNRSDSISRKITTWLYKTQVYEDDTFVNMQTYMKTLDTCSFATYTVYDITKEAAIPYFRHIQRPFVRLKTLLNKYFDDSTLDYPFNYLLIIAKKDT
jgi:hypothetical protein